MIVVGVRLAHDVRRAGGVRDQLPVTLLLDGRRLPALGLAVLLRGRGLPGEEGTAVLGGFFLGYSTLLRIFPLFIFSGPILVIAAADVGDARRPTAPWWKSAAPAAPGGRTPSSSPLFKPQPRDRARRCSRAPIAATCRSSRARRWRWRPGADQPRHQQRHRRLQGVHVQHAQAQGDAAHQPHGVADGRHLQPVGGGAVAAERARRGSVGHVEARRRSPTFKRRFPLYLLFVAGFVGDAVRGAARRPSRGSPARWDR